MNTTLDVKSLENWLWEAACKIRGPVDAPKYKDYILPLIFFKRLSDVFEDELDRLSQDYGSKETVEKLLAQDHKLVRFYLPKDARWEAVANHTTNVGEHLTNAVRSIAHENAKLQGVVDTVDFNATTSGQRILG
ncbi:MAG TPA: type I restriction-modification system subunit M N-terminal domain-containing protein, partial [Spirochaetota bacterium]|nr:type I restriction-modification system subunit M N-terminal domain-containing protein [Spirochaetota bacterium]HRR61210.1 type I restriction-modification system subunit M N-terminal domain-containing protein [Spirochaetota bacterium]